MPILRGTQPGTVRVSSAWLEKPGLNPLGQLTLCGDERSGAVPESGVASPYGRTPNFRRKVIIGHQLVNAD